MGTEQQKLMPELQVVHPDSPKLPDTLEEYYATNKCVAFHYGRCRILEDYPDATYLPPYAFVSTKEPDILVCGAAIGNFPQHLGELQRANCRGAFKSIDCDFKKEA
jgi:hypothetical protein